MEDIVILVIIILSFIMGMVFGYAGCEIDYETGAKKLKESDN